jgi:putative ABC transport system permease protein
VAAVSRVTTPSFHAAIDTLADPDCSRTCRSVNVAVPPANRCPLWNAAEPPTAEQEQQAADDPRCQMSGSYTTQVSGPVVGDYAELVRLTGAESAAARRVLTGGGMVVFDTNQVDGGQAQLEVYTYTEGASEESPPEVVQVPAAYVELPGQQYIAAFLSPAAAARTGVKATPESVLLRFDELPTEKQEQAVRGELERLGMDSWFQVERGYRDNFGPGLLALLLGSAVITLGAAGIATGLAQADARADHATLAAIGAPARLRRTLSAAQAATVAVLGSLLGTVSGFVPAIAFLYALPGYDVVVPWLNLLVIVLVVPLVAAACAWLLTRSRLPMERRVAA